MKMRYFALILGIIYLAIGILGFIPAMLSLPSTAPAIALKLGYGYLFGWFATNLLHNLVRLVVGVLGVITYFRAKNERLFARSISIFFALLTVLGLIPATSTLFGLMPLFGHNIWLHALTALVAAYFGYLQRAADVSVRAA